MKNREIGHIISKGGKIKDIQKVVPNFPENPTKETFIELGYKESTAKRYCSLLSHNSTVQEATDVASKTEVKINSLINIMQSDNADYNNILVDTCALVSENSRLIIGNANHVTFTLATLDEMDSKKREYYQRKKAGKEINSDLVKIAKYIPIYTSKILDSPDKYMVSKFRGYSDEEYVDNVLLQYLEILPKQIRPTILTADRNLAAKAKALEIDYIFIDKNAKGENQKKIGYGITMYKANGETYIVYTGTQTLEIHRKKQVIPYTEKEKLIVQHGDQLCLNQKLKGKILKHIIEID